MTDKGMEVRGLELGTSGIQRKDLFTMEDEQKMSEEYIEESMRMMRICQYLECTGRFRENPRYADCDFFTYLYREFGISKKEYSISCLALTRHRDDVMRFGLGAVKTILAKSKDPEETLRKIREIQEAKPKKFRIADIDRVIEYERGIQEDRKKRNKGLRIAAPL